MLRTKLCLAAVALLSATLAAPADAAGFRVCDDTGTVTFDPPLTTTIQFAGEMTVDYDLDCVGYSAPLATGSQSGHVTVTYGYQGSCTSAAITGGGGVAAGALVGGTAGARLTLLNTFPIAGVRVFVIVPHSLNPCDMTTGTYQAVGVDVAYP